MGDGDPSASVSWDFHRKETAELDTARTFALGACRDLKRLLESIHDDNPNLAAAPIGEFIEHWNGHHTLNGALRVVGRFIEQVAIPTGTPSTCNECRGRDGHRVPTLKEINVRPSAHEAAQWVYSVFGDYLQHKAIDQLTWHGYLSLRHGSASWKPDVVDAIIDARWREIRDELLPVTSFDCGVLKANIERESRAAFELSRDTAMRGHRERVPGKGDLITIDEVARLAGAERKTLQNIIAKAKGTGEPIPAPVVAQSGSIPAKYSYSAIRPWLIDKWQNRAVCFPESYAEARSKLA